LILIVISVAQSIGISEITVQPYILAADYVQNTSAGFWEHCVKITIELKGTFDREARAATKVAAYLADGGTRSRRLDGRKSAPVGTPPRQS
jgi:hypothetical protein